MAINYDMDDPEDAQRFKLNLMCSDLVFTMQGAVQGKRIGPLYPMLEVRFTELVQAIKALSDATKPKGAR